MSLQAGDVMLGDRVLLQRVDRGESETMGGILIPSTRTGRLRRSHSCGCRIEEPRRITGTDGNRTW